MAHTYSIVKSWVDKSRPGVHCGYVNITMADDASADPASTYSIDAEDVNPNCSTLYQLTPISGVVGTDDDRYELDWSYANQYWTIYDADTGSPSTDVDILDGAVIYCYYEGA